MHFLQRLADTDDAKSLSNRLRSKRFRLFERLSGSMPRPLRIIDIGGTVSFWEQRGWAERPQVQITLVNLAAEQTKYANIDSRVGSATDLSEFGDKSYHVAFSNSVIEHLFTLDAQAAMAREVQRVGCAYWVQTPNFWFPIEPHFHIAGWQWLPSVVRIALIRRMRCGHRGPCKDIHRARQLVEEIRLLTHLELRRLFPGATIWGERFFGIVKSWVVWGGFGRSGAG